MECCLLCDIPPQDLLEGELLALLIALCISQIVYLWLQTVRKQFDSEALRMLPPKEFQFKDCEDDAKLTLDFSRSIDGWTIARECLNKEVC